MRCLNSDWYSTLSSKSGGGTRGIRHFSPLARDSAMACIDISDEDYSEQEEIAAILDRRRVSTTVDQ